MPCSHTRQGSPRGSHMMAWIPSVGLNTRAQGPRHTMRRFLPEASADWWKEQQAVSVWVEVDLM